MSRLTRPSRVGPNLPGASARSAAKLASRRSSIWTWRLGRSPGPDTARAPRSARRSARRAGASASPRSQPAAARRVRRPRRGARAAGRSSRSNSECCSSRSCGLPSARPQKLISICASRSRRSSSGSASSMTIRSASSPVRPAGRGGHPGADPPVRKHERRTEYVRLVVEVVRQDAARAVRLPGDGADGRARDAVPGDHAPGSRQDLVSPRIPVDDLWHRPGEHRPKLRAIFLSDVRLTSVMYCPDAAELQAAREQLVAYSARLLDDGLAVGAAGNMSVRLRRPGRDHARRACATTR